MEMKRVKSRQRCKGSQAVPEGTVRACCEDLERFHEIYQSVNEFIYEHDRSAFLGISPFFVGFLGYGGMSCSPEREGSLAG